MLQLMLAVNLSGTEDNGIDLSLLIEDSLKNLDTRMESVLIRYRVSGSDKRTIYSNSGGLGHRIDAKRSLISKIQEGPVKVNTVAVRVFRNAARRPTVAAAGRLFG